MQRTSNLMIRKRILFGYMFFLLSLLIIVNAAFPRIQMLLFHDHVLVYSLFLKIGIFILATIYLLILGRADFGGTLTKSIFALLVYLLFDTLYLSTSYSIPLRDLCFGYDTMYSILILAGFVLILRPQVPEKSATKIIIFISIPLLVLGISQSILNNPILSLRSENDYFIVLVWNYYGQVRAFSLFSAPAYYASYLVFFGSLLFAMMLRHRGKKVFLESFLFSIVLFSLFYSLNRTAIFAMGLSLLTVFLIVIKNISLKVLPLLMMGFFIASIFLVIGAPMIAQQFPYVFAFKIHSLVERYEEWRHWITFLVESPMTLLLGSGIFQNGILKNANDIIIDNMFLAVLVQIGVIGLALVLFVIYETWHAVGVMVYSSKTPIGIAGLSLITMWPVFAMFGTGLNIFPLYMLLLAAIGCGSGEKRQVSRVERGFPMEDSCRSARHV
jgi:hypothetical protein